MTEADRDLMRSQDHSAIARILGMVQSLMQGQTDHIRATNERLQRQDDKIEAERLRGELRDREARKTDERIAAVDEKVDRIETGVNIVVAQLRNTDAQLRQNDDKLIERVDAEEKRQRVWLGVTFDGPAVKLIAVAIGGVFAGLAATFGWIGKP